jgi:hypothetical protein
VALGAVVAFALDCRLRASLLSALENVLRHGSSTRIISDLPGVISRAGCSSFPESSDLDSRRRKQAFFRQHLLEAFAGPARTEIVSAQLLGEFLGAVEAVHTKKR